MFVDKPGVGAANMQVNTGGKIDFHAVADNVVDVARSIRTLERDTHWHD